MKIIPNVCFRVCFFRNIPGQRLREIRAVILAECVTLFK